MKTDFYQTQKLIYAKAWSHPLQRSVLSLIWGTPAGVARARQISVQISAQVRDQILEEVE